MSYMQVVAYTHSGHSPSVLYGFACLFVIGFLWAALGGAGTALAGRGGSGASCRTCSSPWRRLLRSGGCKGWRSSRGSGRAAIDLNWYDTDWLAATLALVGGLLVWAIRRRLDRATALILCMAVGWWAGFAHPGPGAGPAHDAAPRRQLGGLPGDDAGPASGVCRRIGLGEVARAAAGLRLHRRDRLRRGVDAQARRGHQRLRDQLAQHPRADDGPVQRHRARRRHGAAGPVRTRPRTTMPDAGARPPDRALSPSASSCWGSPISTCGRTSGEWVRVGAVPAEMAGLSDRGLVRPGVSPVALTLRWRSRSGTRAPAGDPAGEPDGPGAVALSRAALVAGRRQLRTCPGLLHGPTARDRGGHPRGRVACTLLLLACTPPNPRVPRPRRDVPRSADWTEPCVGLLVAGPVNPLRLGRRSGHLRRQIRWPRQSPHPLGPRATIHQAEKR